MDYVTYMSRRSEVLVRLLMASQNFVNEITERPLCAKHTFLKALESIETELEDLDILASGGSVTAHPDSRPFRASGAG